MLACGLVLSASLGQTTAFAQADGEREAEPMVSLSAGAIIEILRREPGLLLEVKRELVRIAYEQGRLLDATDLTDEALFQLLRGDDSTRVLATREIEKRQYVRSKPTPQEIAKDGIEPLREARGANTVGTEAIAVTQSAEDRYWAEHEKSAGRSKTVRSLPPDDGFSSDGFVEPEAEAPHTSPLPAQPPLGVDNRRQNLAGLQLPARDSYEGAPTDGGALPRTNPEGMPGLLSASMDEPVASEPRRSSTDAFSPLAYSSVATNNGMGPERSPSRIPKLPPPAAEEEDHPAIRRRPNPYAEVPSLYDLYAQISRHSPALARFGEDVFRNGTGNFDELPMDLPVGPDYVLGPGDGLGIELWGSVSQRLERTVDRQGRVALPEAGAVQVTGHSLGEVQQIVESALRGAFRDVHADVSLARLRTVRVYVVGDVLRPGAYDVSSLSTPLNALYQAGGPTARGSLRILRLYRSQQLAGEVDLYDLLLHGVGSQPERLQAGDTIMVPPAGAQLTIEGMVRRPAIYELNHESNLAEALQLAGGVLNTGTLRNIEVERVVSHVSRAMLRLDLPENNPSENNNQEAIAAALEAFKVQDGDKIRISPILPYSEQTVFLDGHVFHPGKYSYREGMRVTDLIASYADMLPEPASRHAEIIRLEPPDYAPRVIAFNLADALAGDTRNKQQNLPLKAFDTVRIFGRFDFEDAPAITVSGEVRHPGEHVTNGETRLRDAVYLAGGVTTDAQLGDAQIFRRTVDGKLKVLSVNLERALAGDATDNVPLDPKDRVFIHRNLSKVDPATVKIEGEVARPGKYALAEEMTAAQLVRLAGGLRRSAFADAADLTRYTIENGAPAMGEQITVPIARALAGEADSDLRLHDGDVLTIRQLAGWNDIGSLIAVKGEVVHPGDYGIREGERLSSVIARAGGLRADAYLYGAILERTQVREMEEQNRADLIRRVQAQQVTLKLSPDAGDADEKLARDAALEQWHATLDRLRSVPPPGRLVIHISKNVGRWANTPADIEVRAGDTLLIPKTPAYVMVYGQVYNPAAISYRPGKSAGWYLRQTGGPTNMADKKAVFVVRGDGSVVGGKGGEWFTGDVQSAELRPGDMVFVPEKALGGSVVWKNTLQAAQLMSTVAIAVSVGHGF